MAKSNKSRVSRSTIVVAAIITLLAAGEFGARLVRERMRGAEHIPPPPQGEGEPGRRVLAIGDDFTQGAGLASGESYPAVLQRLLDESGGDYTVYNLGLRGATGAELGRVLPEWLRTYKPHYVLIMAGARDGYDALAFNEYDSEEEFDDVHFGKRFDSSALLSFAGYLFERFRGERNVADDANPFDSVRDIYYQPTLVRSLWYNHRAHIERRLRKSASGELEQHADLWRLMADGDYPRAVSAARAALDEPGDDYREDLFVVAAHGLYLIDDFDGCIALLKRGLEEFPDSDELVSARAYYLRQFADRSLFAFKLDQAAGRYLRAMRAEPKEFYNYFRLTRIFAHQKEVSAGRVFSVLARFMNKEPYVRGDNMFIRYYGYYSMVRVYGPQIDDMISSLLAVMVEDARESGARVVMLDYPVPYPAISAINADIADTYRTAHVAGPAPVETYEPPAEFGFVADVCKAKCMADLARRAADAILKH